MTDVITSFRITSPGTDTPLERVGDRYIGPGPEFDQLDHGIWDLTRPERRAVLDEFAMRYATVRAAEHRDLEPAAIRALPDLDPSHRLAEMWQQRAQAFGTLIGHVARLEPGTMVDIGAGCGWLAARLGQRGWMPAAIDITVEGGDGLALARHHRTDIFLARAEMQALPFASASLNLAVFNASLHYAADIGAALAEAHRVLTPTGTLMVLDSPVFVGTEAGRQSVAEFAEHVARTYRLDVAAHEGPGFVTQDDLRSFEQRVGRSWARHESSTGLRRTFHRWRGARRAGRETAARPLLIMHPGGSV